MTELSADDQAGLAPESSGRARQDTLNRLLFPGPTEAYAKAVAEFGTVSVLPTDAFWYGLRSESVTEVEFSEGRLLLFGIEAIGDADERGMRNVMGTINGQLRPTQVRDTSVDVKVASAQKADAANPKHVAVPFAGVVHPTVAEGDTVEAGQSVATIEAMKMEASITSPTAGTVARLVITETAQAEGGDLLLEFA